jgi:hypothetical protein
MNPDMERPAADNDGPPQQSGHQLASGNDSERVHCHADGCTTNTNTMLGGAWCYEHGEQFIEQLRRRVARRDARLPVDAIVGLGIFLRPAPHEWPSSFAWLRCDMCPREWVGPQFEVCEQCKRELAYALELHQQHHDRRKRAMNHVA